MTVLLFSGILWLNPVIARPLTPSLDRSQCFRVCVQLCRVIAQTCFHECMQGGAPPVFSPAGCRYTCRQVMPECMTTCAQNCAQVEQI